MGLARWPASFTDRAHCFDPFFVYAGAIPVFFSLHLLLLLVDQRELLLFDGALRPRCFYSALKWFNFAYNSFWFILSVASFIPWFVFVNFKVVAFHLALLFRRIALSSSTSPPKLARNVENTPLTIFPRSTKFFQKFRTSAEPTLCRLQTSSKQRPHSQRWIA